MTCPSNLSPQKNKQSHGINKPDSVGFILLRFYSFISQMENYFSSIFINISSLSFQDLASSVFNAASASLPLPWPMPRD